MHVERRRGTIWTQAWAIGASFDAEAKLSTCQDCCRFLSLSAMVGSDIWGSSS